MTRIRMSPEEKKKHDDVIEFVRADLIKEGFAVKINKYQEETNGINDTDNEGNKIKIYPDVYTYENGIVKRIYGIETDKSITQSQIPQWKQYSKGVDFYLVVPKNELEKMRELVKDVVKIKGFLTY